MRSQRIALVLAMAVPLLGTACSGGEQAEEDSSPQIAAASAVEMPDTTGASVWAYLQSVGYGESFSLWPETSELYAGSQPHGMLLTTYVNDVAQQALTSGAAAMPDGAMVVKENYMPDSTLAAVTVMYKVAGYNPDHADWFFTKLLPSGELDTMPNGMAMEGRLPGCQNCHGGRRDNDYLFTSDLGGG